MTRPIRFGPALASTFVRVAVLIGLVAGVAVTSAPPAGAAPEWTVVRSPSPAGPPIGELSSVSCASAQSCVAVGDGNTSILIERWNGSGWSLVSAPTPRGQTEVELNAVSCSSTDNCIAIGDSATETSTTFEVNTLAERWNGRRWSIIPSPTPSGASDVSLSGVACASARSCFAVGDVSRGSGADIFDVDFTTLVEHWDGTSWNVVPSPNPKGSTVALLSGVSCSSADNCFAVGDYFGRTSAGALIEHWNGTRWSVVAGPQPKTPFTSHIEDRIKPGITTTFEVSGGLSGVSCSSAKSCFAVGNGFTPGGLIERWNGKRWSIVASPTPAGANGGELAGVACASPTDCSAVGDSFSGSISDPIDDNFESNALSEHWNGTVWSITAPPAGAPFSVLSSVSCPRANSCAAVGDSAFAEHWDGTNWSMAPFTSKTSQSQLIGVTCADATSCFAVGISSTGSETTTLIERRVGSRWRIVPSPNPSGSFDSALNGVSCASASDCTAVGSSATGLAQATLIEHWDGTSWSIVPSPDPTGSEAQLSGVSCTSATSCNAVGVAVGQASAVPLIEHWDGVTWSIATSAFPAFGLFDRLIGVSCPSATSCTAVGYYEAVTGTRQIVARTLVEHWNGTSWKVVAGPPGRAAFAALSGVSCPSATNCSAVGVSEPASGTDSTTLAEHWNGKKWAIVASPNPRTSIGADLSSVSCFDAAPCFAVGAYSTLSTTKTLVERWNGRRWTAVASPNPGTDGAGLNGVWCPSPTSCTAVGTYGANDGFFTLIERGT